MIQSKLLTTETLGLLFARAHVQQKLQCNGSWISHTPVKRHPAFLIALFRNRDALYCTTRKHDSSVVLVSPGAGKGQQQQLIEQPKTTLWKPQLRLLKT